MRRKKQKKINLISSYMVKSDINKPQAKIILNGICLFLLIMIVVSLLALNARTVSLKEKAKSITEMLDSDDMKIEIERARNLAVMLDRHISMRKELTDDHAGLKKMPTLASYDLDELRYIASSTSTVTQISTISYNSANRELEVTCKSTSDSDPIEFIKMLRESIDEGFVTFTDVIYNGSKKDGDNVLFTVKCILEAKNEK